MKNGITLIYEYTNNEKLQKKIEEINNQSIKEYQLIIVSNEKLKISENNLININSYSLKKIFNEIKYDSIYFIDDDVSLYVDSLRLMIKEQKKYDLILGNILLKEKNEIYFYNRSSLIYNESEIDYKNFISKGYLNREYTSINNKVVNKTVLERISKYEDIKINERFKLNWLLIKYATSIKNIKNAYFEYTNFNEKIEEKDINYFVKEISSVNDNNNIINNWKRLFNNKENNNSVEEDSISKNYIYYYNNEKKKISDNFITYENIKKSIISSEKEYISFDMFDTLIKRVVLKPTDIFTFLDKKYNEISNNRNYIYFSQMRIKTENECRSSISTSIEEISLDMIYDTIFNNYQIDKEKLEILKKYEIDLEIKYCIRRDSGFELYDLAKYLNKKLILISDIYLPEFTINQILTKNGYEFDYMFVSSSTKKLKYTGNAFRNALKTLNILPNKVIHIGDNYNSDVIVPNKLGIDSYLLPSVYSIMENSRWYRDNFSNDYSKNYMIYDSLDFIGNKCLIAIIINKLYDYPFFFDDSNSMYNSSPNIIGAIPLSMSIFAISKMIHKIVKSKNYEKLHFAARDGFLLMEAYKIMYPEEIEKINYLYLSRKLLIPLSIKSKEDFWSLKYAKQDILLSPKRIFDLYHYHLKCSEKEYIKFCNKYGFEYNELIETSEETDILIKNILLPNFNKEKSEEYINKHKNYYEKIITKNNVLIDIGYSGRAEQTLSNIIGYPLNSIYVHSKNDNPFNRACKENFSIDTILPFLPKISGSIREYLFSKADATCINFDIEKNEYIFENIKFSSLEINVIESLQNSALEILKEYKSTFKDEELITKNNELNELLENFYYSPLIEDAELFKVFEFEDELNFKDQKYYNLYDLWLSYINEVSGDKYHKNVLINQETPIKRGIIKKIIIKICKPIYNKISNRLMKIVRDSTYSYYKQLDNHILELNNNNKRIENLIKEVNRKLK